MQGSCNLRIFNPLSVYDGCSPGDWEIVEISEGKTQLVAYGRQAFGRKEAGMRSLDVSMSVECRKKTVGCKILRNATLAFPRLSLLALLSVSLHAYIHTWYWHNRSKQ